jgi:hypothetical protein
MKTSMPSEKILRERNISCCRIFRGYIVYYRRLVPGKQLVFKNITYVEIDG